MASASSLIQDSRSERPERKDEKQLSLEDLRSERENLMREVLVMQIEPPETMREGEIAKLVEGKINRIKELNNQIEGISGERPDPLPLGFLLESRNYVKSLIAGERKKPIAKPSNGKQLSRRVMGRLCDQAKVDKLQRKLDEINRRIAEKAKAEGELTAEEFEGAHKGQVSAEDLERHIDLSESLLAAEREEHGPSDLTVIKLERQLEMRRRELERLKSVGHHNEETILSEQSDDAERFKLRRLLQGYYSGTEQSHYEVLGLRRSASDEDIKITFENIRSEYEALKRAGQAKIDHQRLFERIEEAFQILSDSERREKYDEEIGRLKSAEVLTRVGNGVSEVIGPVAITEEPEPKNKPPRLIVIMDRALYKTGEKVNEAMAWLKRKLGLLKSERELQKEDATRKSLGEFEKKIK